MTFFGDFPFYYDDRAMKDAEKKLYGHKANHVMKTDIKEMNNRIRTGCRSSRI